METRECRMKKLEYNIHKCSSFSTTYVPENIKENRSNDQSSRWSSDSNSPPQYLTLKLLQPAIVKSITFGKYDQTHVCNIKKFKIFGGLDDTNMMELLEGGLKNDNIPETFALRHTIGEGVFPVRFVQIMPLLSWGPNFNFSIWFVELNGDDDFATVQSGMQYLNYYREREVVRLCLKHFRQQNYTKALKALEQQTGIQLEDPHVSKLHEILVERGDYDSSEKFIEQSVYDGYFQDYILKQVYQTNWQPLSPVDSDPELRPGMRGGHQMCADPFTETIYLFGGWDGKQDLSDLWAYSVSERKWTLLCHEAELENGPSPRSCHKMCIDPKRREIFTLGRYLDTHNRLPDTLKSDFFMYDIESGQWTQITADTEAMGGPQLIFGHQMSMDVEKRVLYVFGGRSLVMPSSESPASESLHSGLFSYQVSTNTWTHLLIDCSLKLEAKIPTIRSRVGHSMLFHSKRNKLYVFGGQRNKEYLNDFFTYDVETHQVERVGSGTVGDNAANVPPPGFTQRATIDVDTDEIYVLSGLSKEKDKRDEYVQNSFWVYNINKQKWRCIYKNENSGEIIEPCPRFAHQLVYDDIKKVHYLFGGNPGRVVLPELRLDDFWQLHLCKPTPEQLIQRCRLMIRKHNFREMAMTDSIAALQYLQTVLYEVIDHNNAEQTKDFQLLASELFREQHEDCDTTTNSEELFNSSCDNKRLVNKKGRTQYNIRAQLFEELMSFFPESMIQPQGSLINMITL